MEELRKSRLQASWRSLQVFHSSLTDAERWLLRVSLQLVTVSSADPDGPRAIRRLFLMIERLRNQLVNFRVERLARLTRQAAELVGLATEEDADEEAAIRDEARHELEAINAVAIASLVASERSESEDDDSVYGLVGDGGGKAEELIPDSRGLGQDIRRLGLATASAAGRSSIHSQLASEEPVVGRGKSKKCFTEDEDASATTSQKRKHHQPPQNRRRDRRAPLPGSASATAQHLARQVEQMVATRVSLDDMVEEIEVSFSML
ncbi:unnamed protein product [Protopolystoma xenopodis]|uniref:Uncharacterized protein n=1 Tax=Protopolystoma xenopodis TaxID=117903 RepID=A0A448XSH0_9PLAT|nr:unnamed protein product [Protopolystoma xenopodis]